MWETKKLGDAISLEYGKPLPKEDRDINGKYPAYGANGEKCRTNRFYHDRQSIIIGRKGSAGEVNLTEGPFWPLDVTYFVTFDEKKYDLTFLFHVLKSLNLQHMAKGVKPGLNRNDVYSLNFSFPPLPEQKRIVAILDEAFEGIDAAIANTQANLDAARELFDSYLNEVFTKIEQKCESIPLSKIVDISHGFAFKGSTFKKSQDPSKYIILTPGNYTNQAKICFTKSNTKRLFDDVPKEYLFEKGDLTVVMTDLSSKMKILGKPAFIEQNNILHNQRIGRLVFKSDLVIPRFVYHFLRTKPVSDQIKQTSTGTMVRHTAPKRILENLISFPATLEQQKNIVLDLDEIEQESQKLECIYQQKLTALHELKQSILDKAFRGELTQNEVAA